MEVLRKLAELPPPEGPTELNTTILATVQYLQRENRPGTRRAIVVLTDNIARKQISDDQVRAALWDTGAVLNAILFPTNYWSGTADVRRFAQATGGEVMEFRPGSRALAGTFERLRRRYMILYRPPAGHPGQMRKIRVDLTPAAKAGQKAVKVRARTAYIDSTPNRQTRP